METKRLRIVHVVFSLSSGGAERVVLNLCNEQSKNHEIVLLTILEDNSTNSFYKPQLNAAVSHVCLNSRRGITFRNFFRVYNILRKQKPDVVHYHLNTLLYGFWPALFLKLKSIHTLHSVAQLSIGFKGQKAINRWFYKTNRIIPVALSKECSTSIETVYGIKNSAIVLNGVPHYETTSKSSEASLFISNLRKTPEHVVYVHVARYNLGVKNQQVLFKLFKKMALENQAVSLVVIGRDFPEIEIPNVYVVGESKNPIAYVASADAMILSSLNEGIPMSVLEAFSCGIPVLSTPAGGMNDLLKNEKMGLLSQDFSEENFQKTFDIITERIRENGFQKQEIIEEFEANYSIENCAQQYIKIYSSK